MPHLNKRGVWEPTPEFGNDTGAQRAYIERETDRWINGYKEGDDFMEGLMYFYVTMGNLKNGSGNVFRPKWRDGDSFLIDAYLEAERSDKNLLVIKRREFGLTSLFGGLLPVYKGVTIPGSTSILTSASMHRLGQMKNQKIYPWKENLVAMKQMPENNLDSGSRYSFASRSNPSEIASEIHFMDTNKDDRAATNLESSRATYIFLDEYFIHNRAEIVLMSAMASMQSGTFKTAIMVLGGSCNDVNQESVPRLTRMMNKPKSYNINVAFIGAEWNLEPYEVQIGENFFSLKDKAREYILNKRQDYRDEKNWPMLDNFVKSYPLELKDVTSSEGANAVSGEIVAVLEKSRAICMGMDEDNYRYKLINNNTNIFPDQDRDGNFFIYNMPQPGHTYIAGSDPIPFTYGSSEKKGSDFVCVIKDCTTNQYVAYMSIRTQDSELAFSEFEKLLMFYKSPTYPLAAPCNMERNMGQVIMDKCKIKQKMYLLATMPGEKIPGYAKAGIGTIVARLYDAMCTYLRYCGTICIHRFLKDMEEFPVAKSDFIDSLQGCELLDSHRNGAPITNQAPSKHQVIKRDGNGKTYVAWE